MRFLQLILIAAFSLASSLPGFAAGPDKKPTPVMDRVNRAAPLIQQGRVSEALDQVIDPVIAEFEKAYGASKEKIYCASSAPETLLYLVKAAADKQNARVVDPGYAYAYYIKGYVCIEQKDLAHAEEYLTRAMALSPFNSQFLSELGNLYQSRRDWTKALDRYKQAAEHAALLDADGGSKWQRRALRGQAFVLVEQGKLDEAEKLHRRCLELDPQDEGAANELRYIAGLRRQSAK